MRKAVLDFDTREASQRYERGADGVVRSYANGGPIQPPKVGEIIIVQRQSGGHDKVERFASLADLRAHRVRLLRRGLI
jgi:hypothetical protein